MIDYIIIVVFLGVSAIIIEKMAQVQTENKRERDRNMLLEAADLEKRRLLDNISEEDSECM